jgi:ABC-type phosphate/phosphonate transport system substrate-binding protein
VRSSLVILVLMLAAATPPRAADATDLAGSRTEIRFAFSKSMFTDVNEADARAAMKVYVQTIGDQNGIYVSGEPILLDGFDAIEAELERGQADVFALTSEEYLALEHRGLEGPFLLSDIRGRVTEDYLLLARTDGTIHNLEDLKGHRLIISQDLRNNLAPLWLEVECRERGLGPPSRLLAGITTATKPTQAVLPAFFGQSDAAVVTANSWGIMCEMNPQLQRVLRVVISSPPLVPALTCFRRGMSEAMKKQIIGAVELSSTKPAYRQLMALFKSDAVGFQPPSVLDSTRELVATFHRLCGDDPSASANPLHAGQGMEAGLP